MRNVVRCATVADVVEATPAPGFYPIDVHPAGDAPQFTVARVSEGTEGRWWFLVGLSEPWTDEMMAGRRIGPRVVMPGEC